MGMAGLGGFAQGFGQVGAQGLQSAALAKLMKNKKVQFDELRRLLQMTEPQPQYPTDPYGSQGWF